MTAIGQPNSQRIYHTKILAVGQFNFLTYKDIISSHEENDVMPAKPLPDEVLIETLRMYEAAGFNVNGGSRLAGIPRKTFENRFASARIRFPNGISEKIKQQATWTYERMKVIEEPSSVWIIGSDLHVWTNEPTPIFQAFCKLAKKLKVTGIVMNGDVIDGARISRHGSTVGIQRPKIDKEIETAQQWFRKLPFAKYRLWTLGNHDLRLDNYLANQASELEEYAGRLHTRFPEWDFAYAFDINGTEVRHRFRSGIHAGWNNALHGGVNVVTGHTHQLQLTAMRDRRGTRWGVETGTMADPKGPQFEYAEGQPSRAHMGFVVLTFDEDSEMMPPELCEMVRGRPVFRGSYVDID